MERSDRLATLILLVGGVSLIVLLYNFFWYVVAALACLLVLARPAESMYLSFFAFLCFIAYLVVDLASRVP